MKAIKKNSLVKKLSFLLLMLCLTSLESCKPAKVERGEASYYHNKYKGRPTASGEKFRQYKRTAAHKTLPLGTKVKVTNLKNGKSVRVRINDRGPFIEGRIIDLTRKAARKIDMITDGIAPVKIQYKTKLKK